MNDQGECPIPDTHHKFKEATYFLGKCAEYYHAPTEFLFNLNAFIQALRNTTFMLQSEPSKPEGFESWYASKQAEMRQSDLLRRFVQARNIVVKQSSLKVRSTAWSGLFRGRRFKLGMQHPFPLFAPSAWVLERLKARVGFFLDEEHLQPWEQFGVHRTWVVLELGEVEALSLCTQALNHVGAVVREAHSFFGADVENTVVELDMLLFSRPTSIHRSLRSGAGVTPYNMVLILAPFSRWTLRDKAAQRRLALCWPAIGAIW